jgi:hypothetical protein
MRKQNKTETTNSRREWLLRTAIALGFSVAGFLAKDLYEGWRQERSQKRAVANADLSALRELAALLDESHRTFSLQNEQAGKLLQLLKRTHGRKVPHGLGYDETFHRMYPRFTSEEAALQRLIRSTTVNSQRRINLALAAWLERSAAFLYDDQPTPQRQALAQQLRILQLHLNQWHDKYDAWIANDPKRSLVYLAEDEVHGAGIPLGLEDALQAAITAWH